MKLPAHNFARHARRGSPILEAVAALALLAGGLIFTVHVLSVCAIHRRASEQILAAQLEAANLADRVALVPYASLEAANLKDWKLSGQLLELIPTANLMIKVVDSEATGQNATEPRHKQITVQIEWPAVEGDPTGLQLSTWRFARPVETQPPEPQP